LLLALAVAFAYANSLKVEFIYDDYAFVYNNEAIRTFTPLSKFLFSNEAFSQPVNYHVYRPLASFSFAINYAFGSLSPFGYHFVNVLFHTLNVFLLFLVLRKIGFRSGPSFAAAIVFAIHPVHTEAVTWISGRGNVLFLFFFLIAYLLYMKADADDETKRLVLIFGAAAAYGLALLAKEMAMPLPAILFGHDLYFHPERSRRERLRRFWVFVPFILVAIIYVLTRSYVLGKVAQVSYHGGSSYMTFLLMLKAFAIYARLLFIPVDLSLSRHFQHVYSLFDMSVFPSFCIVAVATVTGTITFRRSRHFSFAFFWFAVTMLPVSNIIPVNAIVADRFLYGPSIGFCILIAVWLTAIPKSEAARRLPAAAAIVLVLFFYMALSIGRNNDWADAVRLWSKTAKASPTSFTAFNNLGFEYMRRGRIAESIEAFNKALEIKGDLPEAHLNLATCYSKINNIEMAVHHYNAALPQLDNKAETRHKLGELLERRGSIDQAITQYEQAVTENPGLIEARRRLAVLYSQRDIQRAIDHYSALLEAVPDDADSHYRLGFLYYRQSDMSNAVKALQKSLSVDPGNNLAHELLARIRQSSTPDNKKNSD